jgi:hypothetical protein
MTSREKTWLLPRSGDEHVVGDGRRSLSDWAALLGIGAIQWPWLLRSLNGGSKASKRALLDRLELPHDALPNLGSWKADTGLLRLVAEHILSARPKLVVEFGTGASTLIIARALQMAGGGTLISFEQHAEFVEATRNWLSDYGLQADLRAVPLRPFPKPVGGPLVRSRAAPGRHRADADRRSAMDDSPLHARSRGDPLRPDRARRNHHARRRGTSRRAAGGAALAQGVARFHVRPAEERDERNVGGKRAG